MKICLPVFLALCAAAPGAAFAADIGDTSDTIQPTPHNPEPTETPYQDNLLGSLGGARDVLSDKGVEVLLEYKADMFAVTKGGIKRGGAYLDNLDLRFDMDNEKLFGLHGNKSAVHFTNNFGDKPGARLVGNAMGIDNIETTKSALILYEAWDDQSFLSDTLSVRAGISDVNNEFMITESSLNFIQPTMQLSQTLAQSGVNGPPTFPYTTLGARLKYLPTEETYTQAAIFNGVAGDPDHLYGNTHFQFNGGAMLIAEAGYTPKVVGVDGKPNILALGGWMYTKRTPDLVTVDANGTPARRRSYGFYGLSSYLFYHDKQDRGLNAFFRPSLADGNTKQAQYAYEVGMVGSKWVKNRPDSEIGVGLSQAINAEKYQRAAIAAGSFDEHSEFVIEAYYRDKLIPGLSVQPDFQYIINPGSASGVKNAVAFGLRTDFNF